MRDADDVILYVGKAINLRNRVRSYFRKNIGRGPAIDNMVENIWLCFVEESCFNYKPPVLLIAFAWYYGLKEGIITKGMPYDQVVYLVRRKVVFRLVDVQMSFK